MSLHYVAVRYVLCVSVLVCIACCIYHHPPTNQSHPHSTSHKHQKTNQAALEEYFSAAAAAPLALAATNPNINEDEDEEEGNEDDDDDGGGCWVHLVTAMRTHARDDPRGVAAWHGRSMAARRRRALLSGGRGVRVRVGGGGICVYGYGEG